MKNPSKDQSIMTSSENMKDDEDDSYQDDIKEIIDIINRKVRVRNQREKSRLYEFFESTNFEREMMEDIALGTINEQNLFFFVSQFMECKTFKKDTLIYYEGTKGEYIYLLLKGEVWLYKLEYEYVNYTPREYYLFLKRLYDNKEKIFIIQNIIEENSKILPLKAIDDLLQLDEILFKVGLIQLTKDKEIEDLKDYFNINNRNQENYEVDKVIKAEIPITAYKDVLYSLMTKSEEFYVNYIINDIKVNIKKIKIKSKRKVKTKEYFGNFSLGDYENKRNETALVGEEALLIVINKKMYSQCVLSDKKSFFEKAIDNIHQGSFFSLMRKDIFAKHFFYELRLEEFTKGEIIYKEGDTIDYVYLIKEGSFQMSLQSKSLLEIKDLITKIKQFEPKFKKEQFDDVCQLKNNFNSLIPLLKQKKKFSLFVVNKGVFGLWEYSYKTKMIMNIKVLSNKAKCYKIKASLFENKENEDYNLLHRGIKTEAFDNVELFLERLIMLKNSCLIKIDTDYTNKTIEECNNYYNTQNVISQKNTFTQIKSLFSHTIKSKRKNDNLTLLNRGKYYNHVSKSNNKQIKYTINESNLKESPKKEILGNLNTITSIERKDYKDNDYGTKVFNTAWDYMPRIINNYRIKERDRMIKNNLLFNSDNLKSTVDFPRIFIGGKIKDKLSTTHRRKIKNGRINDSSREKEFVINGQTLVNEIGDENKKNINYLVVKKFYDIIKIRKRNVYE